MTDTSDPVPALKQQLALAILDHFRAWGQCTIAHRLGVDQPRASDLQHGRLQRFSLQQLVRLATRAGGEVTLSVRWTSRRIWIIPRVGSSSRVTRERPWPHPRAPATP